MINLGTSGTLFGKKGQGSRTIVVLIAAVLVLVVVILLIAMFSRGGSTAFGGISDTISSLGDCDEDLVANLQDKCPCLAGDPASEFAGCPSSVREEADLENYQCSEEELAACAAEEEEEDPRGGDGEEAGDEV